MRMTSWARDGAFGLSQETNEGLLAAEASAITLLWLCASTNRRVRDDATKGIVTILDVAPAIMEKLYDMFCDINDPYVVQRLYAAFSGHAMRTYRATEYLTCLAQAVLRRAQNLGLPIDILARDYARTIGERALFLGAVGLEGNIAAVRPPYGATPPESMKSDDDLFERYSWKKSREAQSEYGLQRVRSSLDSHGDFARYIVRTDSRGDWLSIPLTEEMPLTLEEQRAAFTASLTPVQARLQKKLLAARRIRVNAWRGALLRVIKEPLASGDSQAYNQIALEIQEDAQLLNGDSYVPEQGDIAFENERRQEPDEDPEVVAEHRFLASLDANKIRLYKELNTARNDLDRYDLTQATRWMFRRILEMGYGNAEMSAFDERVTRAAWEDGEGRRHAKIERIGKKYQWIVYFEFLARMADNYYLKSLHSDDKPVRYEVPLQLLSRDIDPSLLVVETLRPSYDPHVQSWWAGATYTDWQEHVEVDDWMRDKENLPDPRNVLSVADPDGVKWICLSTDLNWREREVLLQEKYDVPRRELWYIISAYLVPKTEAQRAYRWLRGRNFSGRWLRPETYDAYRLLWGELFWAPSFEFESQMLAVPPHMFNDVRRKSTKDLLVPATGAYVHEHGNDNSVFDTIRIGFPIANIVRGVGGISSNPERGAWLDASGQTVCFDPSVSQAGPGAVLVRRDRLETFLRDSPFALVWTLLSEKQIIGGNTFAPYRGRFVTSGAYWLHEALDGTFKLEGGMTSRFEASD